MNRFLHNQKLLLLTGIAALGTLFPVGHAKVSQADFMNPPSESRPRVWWHWINGNITKDGIYKDLMWMNRIGIGGFHHFDAGTVSSQVVDNRLGYMDPGWKDAFRYATSLADSLGMEMAVAGAPGWSCTGGPWVTPAQAMKKLTWRECTVTAKNGKECKFRLPDAFTTTGFFQNVPPADNPTEFAKTSTKEEWYEDIAVIAVRLNDAEKTMENLGARISSSGGDFTLRQLTDGDLFNSSDLPAEEAGHAWIQYDFPTPTTIKAVTVADGTVRDEWACNPARVWKHLEASDDGREYHRVCDIPHGGTYRQTIDIPETTARFFRICFDNPVADGLYDAFNGVRAAKSTKVAELQLHTVARVNHAEEKAGFATPHDMMENVTPDETAVSSLADVVDISDKVDDNGYISWNAPEGTWRIYRFGYSLTGKKNHPAPPEATGLEVDKLDRQAVRDYLTHYITMYKEASGGQIGDHGLGHLLIDSYEAGWETWTSGMREEFKNRRGYDVVPWLPVLTGQIIGSTEESEQFLWDWRKTIGELLAENFYGEMKKVASENGLKCYFESHENGRMYLVDGMEAKTEADIPMAAMWALEGAGGANHTMSECDIRESAAVAHIYGQNIVSLESFTSNGLDNRAYSFCPANLKQVADLAMSCGVNRFIIHESAHQPSDSVRPGLGLLIFGQWFNRHETWAEQAKAWTDYLARSSYMLQQGRYAADILYYYGEDNSITGLFAHGLPEIPEGYSFDYVNANALLNELTFDGENYNSPKGNMSYRLLVLDRNASKMSLPVLRKIAEFVRQGGAVCGQRPEWEPSLKGDKKEFLQLVDEIWGKDRKNVYAGLPLAGVLKEMGVKPDFNTNDHSGLKFVHRATDDGEIYWIGNMTDNPRQVKATFRTCGRRPMLWHPETGKKEAVSYRFKNGVTEVAFGMTQRDAVFIVFDEKTDCSKFDIPSKEHTTLCEINTPWEVSFQEKGATSTDAVFDKLCSWTESSDNAIKYFSGTAVYKNKFNLPGKTTSGDRYLLDLGKVGVLCEVIVNGQNLGILWKSPYRIDITEALKDSGNTLEIKVTNLWANRIIGDKVLGSKNAYPAFDFFKADSPLLPSGLIGPVRILKESAVEVGMPILMPEEGVNPHYTSIRPGEEWLDTNGKPIQAHGFSVIYDENDATYYWYGEDKERTTAGSNVWTYGVRCYSSKDFYNWEDGGHIVMPDTVNALSPIHYSQGLDRPHIIRNPRTGKYLCWIKNLSDETQFFTVLQSDNFMGPYEIVNPGFKPNGYEAGDFDLYADPATGKGYVWFERPHWELICCELNDDFTGVTDKFSHHYEGKIPPFTREAPTHFVRQGKHYLFSSGTSGYYPNESLVSAFNDCHGKYKDLGTPHPADTTKTSFYSQITDVIKIPGKKDLYVAVADRWMPQIVGTDGPNLEWDRIAERFKGHRPHPVSDSPVEIMDRSSQTRTDWDVTFNARYVWLPVRFVKGKPVIDWKDEWRLEDYE